MQAIYRNSMPLTFKETFMMSVDKGGGGNVYLSVPGLLMPREG